MQRLFITLTKARMDASLFSNNDFDTTAKNDLEVQKSKIHIRFQKTGPRSITIVEGLDDDLDLKRISKALKKTFSCAATIQKDVDGNEIIQLQGDHCNNVKKWLIEQEIISESESKERIVMHGL